MVAVNGNLVIKDANMIIVRKVFLLLLVSNFIFACKEGSIENIEKNILPPKIEVPEPSVEILNGVITTENAQDYFPAESKTANVDINSPEEAFLQLKKLYPEKGKKVECWTEFNNHFVFSLQVGNELKNAYLYILYVPVGGRKYSYFWPHT